VKTPTADVTWQKGAKRQMANLDRFIEELLTFDEREIAEHTIKTCDELCKRIETSGELSREPNQPYSEALTSLKQWISGVIKYHTLMFNYVQPLHKKVQEIEKEVKEADQKLTSLNRKSDVKIIKFSK
jgi:dynein heavy chain